MKNTLFIIAALIIASKSFGALAPYEERARQLKAILDSDDVKSKFVGERAPKKASGLVDAVEYVANARNNIANVVRYMVRSGACTVGLNLKLEQEVVNGRPVIGAPKITIQVDEKVLCK